MKNQPKISVLLPVLNGEKHLREAINSIISQTFTDWELIIINDGSTDSTPTILNEYVTFDKRIQVITHIKKMGLAPALNDGLRTAEGKYIARMDQDDISLPNRFALQYAFLEKHRDIQLLGGGYAPFNEQGHRMNIFHPSTSLHIAWSIITDTRFCHPTVMYRKSVIEKVGVYPTTGAEDFAFFSRIVQNFKCFNLHTILIKYREHSMNYSVTAKPAIVESVNKTFQRNYLYYFANLYKASIFYEYQTKNILRVSNLISIIKINTHILKQARKQYHMNYCDPESLNMMYFLFLKTIRALTNTYTRKLLVNLKHP